MRLPAVIGRVTRACGCGLCQCLNVALAVVALLLTGLILLNSLGRDVPLPGAWSHWVVQRLLPDDLLAEWERATFDLRGGLLVHGLAVRRIPSGELAIAAEMVWIKWSPLSVVFPNLLPFNALDASKARFYLSAQFSPSGLNEPVLSVDHARLRVVDGRLEIRDLQLRAGGVQAFIRGGAPVKALRASLPAGYPAPVSRQALLQQVHEMTASLNARLWVDWTVGAGGRLEWEVEALSPAWAHPRAKLDQVHLRAAMDWDGHAIRIKHLRGSAVLAEPGVLPLPEGLAALLPDQGLPFDLIAEGPAVAFGKYAIPAHLRLSTRLAARPPLPALQLVLSAPLPNPETGVHWILAGNRLFATGSARPASNDQTSPSTNWEFPFRATLMEPTLAEWWPTHPQHRLLAGARAGRIAFTGTTATTSPALAGILDAQDLFVGQTAFADIHARLSLTPEALALDPIQVWKNPTEAASGSYQHHFPSQRFSLHAAGAIFPSSLDALLGPWWPVIFTHMVAPEPIPADVTVWGSWHKDEPLECVVWAGGERIRYRGLEVPHLEVRVRRNEDWAVLEHLHADLGDGAIGGMIGWRQHGDGAGTPVPVVVDLASDAAWPAVVAASGLDYLGGLEFTGHPRVRVRGVLWDAVEADGEMWPDLRLELRHSDGQLRIAGLHLADVQLTGRATGRRVRLNPVAGDIAGGVFTGAVELVDWDIPDRRVHRMELQVFDANFGEAALQLADLMADPEAFLAGFPHEAREGRLEADFVLTLGPGDTLEGAGRLSLRQARLGQIHLLGGLSRFLADRGLGFSSLDLKAATLRWRLEPEVLQIERCLLTGPVLSLDMGGTMDLASRQLNLRADLILFRGLLGRLLAPVSENFQFDVTGPLHDPTWQLRLSPLRWFQDRLPQPFAAAP